MNASEVVLRLQDLIKEYGDLPVFFEDSYDSESFVYTVEPRYIQNETFIPSDISHVDETPRFVII